MSSAIGQRLKQAREAKHISIEKASEITRIRVGFLKSLEEGDLSAMPSPVQARGFLRNYAEFLGLDFDGLLNVLRAERQASLKLTGPSDSTAPSSTPTPEPESPKEETPPPQPKRRVRKKVESQSGPLDAAQGKPASVETSTKRRARKKEEVVVEPPLVSEVEPQPEPVIEDKAEPQPESVPEPAPEENIWQNWMDRVKPLLASFSRGDESAPQSESQEIVSNGIEETPVPQPNGAQAESIAQSSSAIFVEVGAELHKRREMLSLNLIEIERNIRVKAHYLEALEKGAIDDLPSTVQTRGMLSSYATFLDMDVDALLLRFADALQARHRERNPQKPARRMGQPIIPDSVPPIRSFIAGDLIFGVGMAVLLIGFAIWGVGRVISIRNARVIQPTAPSISQVLLSTPDASSFTPTATFLPAQEIPGEATATIEIPTLSADINVQINIVAVERTYMRVIVDGEIAFDGRVIPGSAYPFDASDQIEILAGSGAALRVAYNGRDLGLMGDFGQVVDNIYTIEGIVTPTPLPTATSTITPRPTSTIPPTPTLRPTSTPVPTSTPRSTNTP